MTDFFEGIAVGKWSDPNIGDNTNSIYAGVGTHTLNWGNANFGTYPDGLSFTINPFATEIGTVFKIGELSYFNGEVLLGTEIETAPLALNFELYEPTRLTKSFVFEFDIDTTPNDGTPEENADTVFPLNKVPQGFFTESGVNYTIELQGFSQDNGLTIEDGFKVLEGETTNASLYAKIVEDTRSSVVDSLVNPVYRLQNLVTGVHLFTASESERESIQNNRPEYIFEGVAFNASISDGLNLDPVYRFVNTGTGSYFYSASESERQFVQDNLPQYNFEGIAFYTYEAYSNLGSEVYRFSNTVTGSHFYTISPSERDYITSNLPEYILEGVAFEAGSP